MFLLLALLSALAFSSAFPVSSPEKELVFDYNARIRVGTYEPKSFASQFDLDGKLHLQRQNERSTLVRLSDLTFKLFNGEINLKIEQESNALPLPQEAEDLQRVFRIEYDEDGKLKELGTETNEQQFSVNIKKAIASLLQLDTKNLELENENPKRRAFVTEETSVYGRGLEEYNVEFLGDRVVIQKMRDVKSSNNWVVDSVMNLEPVQTEGLRNSPVSASSQREYTLVKDNEGRYQMKSLEAHGGVQFHLLRGQMDAQYVSVNQKLNLLQSIQIKNTMKMNNEKRTKQIEFETETNTKSGALPNFSSGRNTLSQEQIVSSVQRALEDVVIYLETNQLNPEAPDERKSQALNRLQYFVGLLDIQNLEQLLTTLQQRSGQRDKQILTILQQILPQVGSRASVIVIKNMVVKNKVNEDVLIDLLNKMPLNLRMPSGELLEEVEILADLSKEYSLNLRRAGVLSFATLVHKTYLRKTGRSQQNLGRNQENILDPLNQREQRLQRNQKQERNENDQSDERDQQDKSDERNLRDQREQRVQKEQSGERDQSKEQNQNKERDQSKEKDQRGQRDEDINRVEGTQRSDKNQDLTKYVKKFVKCLEQAEDYPTQLLNLQALYNIQIGVSKYLEKLTKGEGVNHHVQFHAMVTSMADDVKDPEGVFQKYWPIFTNRKAHIEIRAAAYYILMSTQVAMGKLWNIYWFMQSEENPELYNFVFTNLQSLAESKNPTLHELRTNARQILKFVRKPLKNYLSGNYIFDFEDPKYNFGMMLQTMLISTKTSKALFIDVTNNIMDIPFHLQSLLVKIDGLDPKVADKLPKDKFVKMNIAELEELAKIIMSLPDNKNLHIEYSVIRKNQVFRIGFIDQSNIRDLVQLVQDVQLENLNMLKSSLQIQYDVLSQIVIPNDLGLPTTLLMKIPKLTNNLLNIKQTVVNKITNIQADIRLQTLIQSSTILSFYNPIADIWQGIRRINTIDQNLPLNFNLAVNNQQNSIKLTLNANQDQEKGIIGLRSHVMNEVFVFSDENNNFLKQSNSRCNLVEEVTKGKQNKNVVNLLSAEDENTGTKLEVTVFDNERQVSRKNLVDLMTLALRSENRNDQNEPLVGWLMSLKNIGTRILTLPGVGTTGVLIRAVPSKTHKVSQIDLSLRVNQENNQDDNEQLSSNKVNARATISWKQPGDKLIKTWDINANVEQNSGHTVNNLKLQISRIIPNEKNYKICIDGIKKWAKNEVTGHLSITAGVSGDNQCAKDEILVDINMKGENNNEQEQFDDCSNQHLYNPLFKNHQSNILPVRCVERQTSVRQYEYDIKTTRIPQQIQDKLNVAVKVIKELLRLNINQYQSERHIPVENNSMKIKLSYAQNSNEIDLVCMRPKETFKISGVQLPENVFTPDNTHYSQKFLLMERLGLINSCIVSQQSMLNNQNEIQNQENTSTNQNDWKIYLQDKNDNKKFNVAIRKVTEQQNQLALQIISRDQKLEIRPSGDQLQVLLNNQPITVDKDNRQESWFSIRSILDQQSLIVQVPSYGLFVQCNGRFVVISVTSVTNLEGKCLER